MRVERVFAQHRIEVDFVVPENELAIQVSYVLGDETGETYRRETQALVKLSKRLPYHDLIIVTYNEEREIEVGGKCISVVPAWKWLIGG